MGVIIINIKWEEDPHVATDTRRISLTPSHASTVVCLIPKSGCTMVE